MGSDFLFTAPSLVAGVARMVDLFGELDDYNLAPSPEIADALALWVDWRAVGGDLAAAIDDYGEQSEARQLRLFPAEELAAAAAQ